MPTVTTPGAGQPELAELDRATANTQSVLARGGSAYERYWAAEQEAGLYNQFPAEPAGHPGLETHEAQAEAG